MIILVFASLIIIVKIMLLNSFKWLLQNLNEYLKSHIFAYKVHYNSSDVQTL